MNRQLTAAETKKIMLIFGLLVALCGAGSVAAHKMAVAREEEHVGQQMDREAELAPTVRGAATQTDVENDPEKQLLKSMPAQP